jgi:hypothetical protein
LPETIRNEDLRKTSVSELAPLLKKKLEMEGVGAGGKSVKDRDATASVAREP